MSAQSSTAYAAVLRHIRDELEQQTSDNSITRIDVVEQFVREVEEEVPGLLPKFDPSALRGRWPAAFGRYDMASVRAWIALALGRLEAPPPTGPQSSVSAIPLKFVSDPKLREILEADMAELRRAYAANCLKSTIILCGAAIEALLVDALARHTTGQPNAPTPAKLLEWSLGTLIDKAIEYNLIRSAAAKFSHSVREFRNLVHPGRAVRETHTIDQEEARIAIEILNIVVRDLSALASGGGPP